MAETSKAHNRRVDEGFYKSYIKGKGIDIGCGRIDTHDGADPIAVENCIHHDKDMCDATTMDIFKDNEFDYVYASHILEHLDDPVTAIKNWVRICKQSGHVIISVPHRDLYERKKTLPSKWNADHRAFYLPYECEPPNTFSVAGILASAGVNDYEMKVQNTCTNVDQPHEHGNGEYSIEVIIKKNGQKKGRQTAKL